VETANLTSIQFFDAANNLIFSRNALVAGNQGLTFLGGVANAGEQIARVRITSGLNTIVSNGVLGNPNDDIVVMDDFLFATPTAGVATPEPTTMGLIGAGILGLGLTRKWLRR
jgi:PEP-CTERM motif